MGGRRKRRNGHCQHQVWMMHWLEVVQIQLYLSQVELRQPWMEQGWEGAGGTTFPGSSSRSWGWEGADVLFRGAGSASKRGRVQQEKCSDGSSTSPGKAGVNIDQTKGPNRSAHLQMMLWDTDYSGSWHKSPLENGSRFTHKEPKAGSKEQQRR